MEKKIMAQGQKPREFWIKATRVRNGLKSYVATTAPINVAGEIHVIEYSYAMKLQDELIKTTSEWLDINERTNKDLKAERARSAKLREALEKIANGLSGFGREEFVAQEALALDEKEHK